ncbi:4'-phosphopantetheinyl transferase superfamily protein [Streptomyces sp. NPDC003036]|uniref:4'-phosphopantetheinyl transferase family protein n=1 Tax=Streptomyces sp. NPDC003036 TaxID=3154442 RepID=UPI0033A31B05
MDGGRGAAGRAGRTARPRRAGRGGTAAGGRRPRTTGACTSPSRTATIWCCSRSPPYRSAWTCRGVRSALQPAEARELAALPEAERPAAFARAWVRKEAYLKGIGTGLGRSPSLDYVGTGPDPADGPPGWRVSDVVVPEDFTAAVAVRRSP